MKRNKSRFYKKTAAILLAAVLILLTAGMTAACGSGGGAASGQSPATGEKAAGEQTASASGAGASGQERYCALSITCETALKSPELKDSLRKILPADGVLLPEQKVIVEEGDSVYDVLRRETRNNKLHMESSESPIYKSQYIEGIGNLYEFDCGDTSGWMYKVNGEFPQMGCSKYQVKEGDVICWIYSCDLGKDIGGGNFQ